VLLNLLLLLYTGILGEEFRQGRTAQQVLWTVVALVLILLVSRGSGWAWGALLAIDTLLFVALATSAASFDLYVVGLVCFAVVEVGILLSRPVRRHLRKRPPRAASAPSGNRSPR
jgi:hypothetical protein